MFSKVCGKNAFWARKKIVWAAAAAVLGAGVIKGNAANAALVGPTGLTAGTTFRYLYVTTAVVQSASGVTAANTVASTDALANGYTAAPDGTALSWNALVGNGTSGPSALIPGNDVFVLPNGTELASSTSNLFGGAPLMNPISSAFENVWTGSTSSGGASPNSFANPNAPYKTEYGVANSTTQWLDDSYATDTNGYPVYAFSNELTVPGASVPEPATLGLLAFGAVPLLMGRRSRKTSN